MASYHMAIHLIFEPNLLQLSPCQHVYLAVIIYMRPGIFSTHPSQLVNTSPHSTGMSLLAVTSLLKVPIIVLNIICGKICCSSPNLLPNPDERKKFISDRKKEGALSHWPSWWTPTLRVRLWFFYVPCSRDIFLLAGYAYRWYMRDISHPLNLFPRLAYFSNYILPYTAHRSIFYNSRAILFEVGNLVSLYYRLCPHLRGYFYPRMVLWWSTGMTLHLPSRNSQETQAGYHRPVQIR